MRRLFPINRSITGNGNRQTLKILQELVPLQIKEYPSGQQVYDWTVPKEWNVRDAWIKNSDGKKIVDFKKNNMHVVGHSRSVSDVLSYEQLCPKLHYRKDLPTAIPYRTSYYADEWGFCLSYEDFKQHFKSGQKYEAHIDASRQDGYLSVGEILIPGRQVKEYLISTYICHPSMANDNLSGIVMTAFLAKALLNKDLNFSYRIVFVPETIGAIAYCANHETEMKAIDCGLVVSCVGGPGKSSYKQSHNPDHFINRIIENVFQETNTDYTVYPFDIHGSDERQYSSPGFRINTASIFKDRYYDYKCYHTSLDDLAFVTAAQIHFSLRIYLRVIDQMDRNLVWKRRIPHGEVMLSKHGLYPKSGGAMIPTQNVPEQLDTMLWLLFYCDGAHQLLEISDKTGIHLDDLYQAGTILEEKGIIERIGIGDDWPSTQEGVAV